MSRYKVLPSIAHNIGQEFVRPSAERGHEYVLGQLLADARRTQQSTLRVDLFTGAATPAALVSRAVSQAIDVQVRDFPGLVAGHHSDMQYVSGARLELAFDLAGERPMAGAPGRRETPYTCRVSIDDDRGKTWSAELHGWCSAPQARAASLFARLTGRG